MQKKIQVDGRCYYNTVYQMVVPESQNVARAICSPGWIRKFDFQKILKKIMIIDNTMIYHCEKF